ncbi:MAG: 50S ribosomal protein L25/general stress protein Ctc [Acidobacteria bacterium]|nr:50S ribosomal protein L25/general stress protein Ctc [Acidobacteriota bacterium]
MAENTPKKSEQALEASIRTEFGKGSARRARRADLIPAVIYGHGAEALHINLPERATTRAVRGSNALLTISINGEEHLALAKEIQRDPLLQIIEHIDLLTVKRGEKVTVDVPVVLHGEAAPGAAVNQEHTTVSLEAEATHIPASVEFSIEGRKVGEHVHASDLLLPKGSTLLTDPETMLVNISEPTVQDLGEENESAEGETAEGSAAASAGDA